MGAEGNGTKLCVVVSRSTCVLESETVGAAFWDVPKASLGCLSKFVDRSLREYMLESDPRGRKVDPETFVVAVVEDEKVEHTSAEPALILGGR